MRGPCLNVLSATSAPKAYRKGGGDKDKQSGQFYMRSGEESCYTHRHIRTAVGGNELYPFRLAVVLRSQEAGLSC